MATTLRGLYAITPDTLDTPQLLESVEQALAGGVKMIQYRHKSAERSRREHEARAVLALCRRYGAALIVNDDWRLAVEVGADGAHLGREDGDLPTARRELGADRVLGVSCYAAGENAVAAKRAGADYVAFGSVFPSITKPGAVRAPLELLGRAKREVGLPVCAIGGITLENAPSALAAGADLLAVITDLFAVADIAARARAYSHLFP